MSIELAPVKGSYLAYLGTLTVTGNALRGGPRRACPVCCSVLARDRDMIVVRKGGMSYWICESDLQMGDTGCGFAFPVTMSKDAVNRLAVSRGHALHGG